MKTRIDGYISSGVNKTGAGDDVVSLKAMESAARILANSIIMSAESHDLPESVMKNIRSIACTKPYPVSNGVYRVDLYFTDDLSRESLYSEQYDGVVNIIALFNNGYLASDTVYGFWDHHDYTGEWNTLRTLPGDDFAYVRSKIGRPALQFMQNAVNDFNTKYNGKYNAVATLDDIYQEIPTVAISK